MGLSSQFCMMPLNHRTAVPLMQLHDMEDSAGVHKTLSDMCSGGLHRCCWALLAQFYPKKYPHNWHVLVLSLACYLVCTAGLSALSWFVERDSFLFACKVPVSGLRITSCYTDCCC